jgi:hypothetical protein
MKQREWERSLAILKEEWRKEWEKEQQKNV